MKLSRVLLSAALVMGILAHSAQATELLENNGFESALAAPEMSLEGNFSPFAGSAGGPAPGFPTTDTINPNACTSHLVASILGEDNAFAGIQQTFSDFVEGETYTYSLFARADGALGINAEFRIEWLQADGATFVGGQFDNNVDITGALGLSNAYQQFSQSDVAPAGAAFGRAVFAVQSFGGGDNNGTVFVDDVSVDGLQAIPEPASAGVIALCLAGFVSRRRR